MTAALSVYLTHLPPTYSQTKMVGQDELLVGEQGEVGQVDGRLLCGPGLVQALQN